MSMLSAAPHVSDAQERERALSADESFLVQAPAGSGKTELLALRYLALLPTVAEPEQVLAITFMRKAAAEMRARILTALERAQRPASGEASEHAQTTRRLATAALAHAANRGWQLLEQPQRLNIQTIDSLALAVAHQMPLLSRLGGLLTPVEEADPLYALAAQRTLALLGSAQEPELSDALARVLDLRDTNLADCESLIAGMLQAREQWLLLLPDVTQRTPDWETLRAELEAPFQRENDQRLALLRRRFAQNPSLLRELLALGRIACDNGVADLAALRNLASLEDIDSIAHWRCVCSLLLTGENKWRRSVDKRNGFPAATHRAEGEQLKHLIQSLSSDDDLLAMLCAARDLPPPVYTEQEWTLVRSIFVLLRRAIAELRVVFAEQGLIDFAEAGIAAHAALNDPAVQMRRDQSIRHILVDEFQDTSRPHLALLRKLLQDWQPGDGRTAFFVGDPMQSIYLFRDAEATLFEQVKQDGLDLDGSRHELTPLRLSTNFRSVSAIVEPLNSLFERVLTGQSEESVQYAPSRSSQPMTGEDAVHMHLQIATSDDSVGPQTAAAAEAEAVLQVIRQHLPAIEQASRDGSQYRVAVLVRARPHLPELIALLRRERIPFRGVKIDLLRDRPEVLDLLSLLRALLHPADRIAWLSVLRAPWCGLPLPALYAICGDPQETTLRLPIARLIQLHADRLDADSRQRALYVLDVLEQAQRAYAADAFRNSPAALALWLERTWHALGAPAYLTPESLANSAVFFSALAEMPPSCFGTLDQSLNRRLEDLYAQPDPETSERYGVQLMTIHGAKGLEFEVVLLPGLDRPGKADDPALFQWLVRKRPATQPPEQEDELLLAPIGRKQADAPPLYEWVRGKRSQRLRQEEKRLLYVACSRAIRELHLFVTVALRQDGSVATPREATLLRAGWDGFLPGVEALWAQATASTSNLMTMPSPSLGNASTPGVVAALAASSAVPRQVLRRLPASWFTGRDGGDRPLPANSHGRRFALQDNRARQRLPRVQGIVLHGLLEHAAAHHRTSPQWSKVAGALLRQHGLTPDEARTMHATVLAALEQALTHSDGRWLLEARTSAWAEASWSRWDDGRLERHRPDRVFLGGESPGAPGAEYLWIVDYKTAALAPSADRNAFLAAAREQYRGQLERYSALFREMAADDARTNRRPHRLALYHPLLPWLDWWSA